MQQASHCFLAVMSNPLVSESQLSAAHFGLATCQAWNCDWRMPPRDSGPEETTSLGNWTVLQHLDEVKFSSALKYPACRLTLLLLFLQCVRLNPDSVEYRLAWAEAQLQRGQPSNAQREFSHCTQMMVKNSFRTAFPVQIELRIQNGFRKCQYAIALNKRLDELTPPTYSGQRQIDPVVVSVLRELHSICPLAGFNRGFQGLVSALYGSWTGVATDLEWPGTSVRQNLHVDVTFESDRNFSLSVVTCDGQRTATSTDESELFTQAKGTFNLRPGAPMMLCLHFETKGPFSFIESSTMQVAIDLSGHAMVFMLPLSKGAVVQSSLFSARALCTPGRVVTDNENCVGVSVTLFPASSLPDTPVDARRVTAEEAGTDLLPTLTCPQSGQLIDAVVCAEHVALECLASASTCSAPTSNEQATNPKDVMYIVETRPPSRCSGIYRQDAAPSHMGSFPNAYTYRHSVNSNLRISLTETFSGAEWALTETSPTSFAQHHATLPAARDATELPDDAHWTVSSSTSGIVNAVTVRRMQPTSKTSDLSAPNSVNVEVRRNSASDSFGINFAMGCNGFAVVQGVKSNSTSGDSQKRPRVGDVVTHMNGSLIDTESAENIVTRFDSLDGRTHRRMQLTVLRLPRSPALRKEKSAIGIPNGALVCSSVNDFKGYAQFHGLTDAADSIHVLSDSKLVEVKNPRTLVVLSSGDDLPLESPSETPSGNTSQNFAQALITSAGDMTTKYSTGLTDDLRDEISNANLRWVSALATDPFSTVLNIRAEHALDLYHSVGSQSRESVGLLISTQATEWDAAVGGLYMPSSETSGGWPVYRQEEQRGHHILRCVSDTSGASYVWSLAQMSGRKILQSEKVSNANLPPEFWDGWLIVHDGKAISLALVPVFLKICPQPQSDENSSNLALDTMLTVAQAVVTETPGAVVAALTRISTLQGPVSIGKDGDYVHRLIAVIQSTLRELNTPAGARDLLIATLSACTVFEPWATFIVFSTVANAEVVTNNPELTAFTRECLDKALHFVLNKTEPTSPHPGCSLIPPSFCRPLLTNLEVLLNFGRPVNSGEPDIQLAERILASLRLLRRAVECSVTNRRQGYESSCNVVFLETCALAYADATDLCAHFGRTEKAIFAEFDSILRALGHGIFSTIEAPIARTYFFEGDESWEIADTELGRRGKRIALIAALDSLQSSREAMWIAQTQATCVNRNVLTRLIRHAFTHSDLGRACCRTVALIQSGLCSMSTVESIHCHFEVLTNELFAATIDTLETRDDLNDGNLQTTAGKILPQWLAVIHRLKIVAPDTGGRLLAALVKAASSTCSTMSKEDDAAFARSKTLLVCKRLTGNIRTWTVTSNCGDTPTVLRFRRPMNIRVYFQALNHFKADQSVCVEATSTDNKKCVGYIATPDEMHTVAQNESVWANVTTITFTPRGLPDDWTAFVESTAVQAVLDSSTRQEPALSISPFPWLLEFTKGTMCYMQVCLENLCKLKRSVTFESTHTADSLGAENIGDEVTIVGFDCSGFLEFVGSGPGMIGHICGVRLSEPLGYSNGTLLGTKFFTCEPRFGIFVPANALRRATPVVHGADAEGTVDSRLHAQVLLLRGGRFDPKKCTSRMHRLWQLCSGIASRSGDGFVMAKRVAESKQWPDTKYDEPKVVLVLHIFATLIWRSAALAVALLGKRTTERDSRLAQWFNVAWIGVMKWASAEFGGEVTSQTASDPLARARLLLDFNAHNDSIIWVCEPT